MSQKYDPSKHHRRSVRHKGWNYSGAGVYFVTICTNGRLPHFTDPALKQIASDIWQKIPTWKQAKHTQLDEWVIMPDHLHGLIIFTEDAPVPPTPPQTWKNAPSGSLGSIIGSYKTAVSKTINRHWQTKGGQVWQRSYHEHIVRTPEALQNIRRYIRENPLKLLQQTEWL